MTLSNATIEYADRPIEIHGNWFGNIKNNIIRHSAWGVYANSDDKRVRVTGNTFSHLSRAPISFHANAIDSTLYGNT